MPAFSLLIPPGRFRLLFYGVQDGLLPLSKRGPVLPLPKATHLQNPVLYEIWQGKRQRKQVCLLRQAVASVDCYTSLHFSVRRCYTSELLRYPWQMTASKSITW